MSQLHQVLAPCPHCLVEGALVEIYDPSLAQRAQPELASIAVEGTCRLCGYAASFGEMTRSGVKFESVFEVMAALDTWAALEGDDDVVRFTQANFQGLSPEQVSDRILTGQPVETGFDVIAWFFPSSGTSTPDAPERLAHSTPRPPPVSLNQPIAPQNNPIRLSKTQEFVTTPAHTTDPRTPGRALISVILADGKLKETEKRFVEKWLTQNKLPSPPPEEWRVWRPLELSPPPDPQATLAAMILAALSDSDIDTSEVRVLREYARAWQVPLDDRRLAPRRGIARILYILSNWVG